jgi:hypothetical protein
MELSDRRFGVEIECGGPRDTIMNALYRGCKTHFHVHGDGSGNEIHTGILKGKRGINRLKKMLDIIRDNQGYVTQSDGMHVHHDAPDFRGNLDAQRRLVRSFLNMENAIEAIIAPYRRGDYGSCYRQFSKPFLARHYERPPTQRGKLNMSNLRTGHLGTIEFRSHEGCLHPEYAAAWVRMGQALLDRTIEGKRAMRTCSDTRTLTRRLGLEMDVAELLVEKAATVRDPVGRRRWNV